MQNRTLPEGPVERYGPALRRAVCNQCRHCDIATTYNPRGNNVTNAWCLHPARPKVLYLIFAHELQVIGTDIVAAPDCPVVAEQTALANF